jgi:hypothetical protein
MKVPLNGSIMPRNPTYKLIRPDIIATGLENITNEKKDIYLMDKYNDFSGRLFGYTVDSRHSAV